MPIHKPEPVLLHHIPLRFISGHGGGKKGVNQEIPLVPFIDFLITLVVFLLMSFSASGELVAQQEGITMPDAANGDPLEPNPIISIDANFVVLDGQRITDTPSLSASPDMQPIDALVRELETAKRNWRTLHPGDDFMGTIVLQVDQAIDYLVVKKVMFSAAQAGYANVNFAVNAVGGD